MNCNQARILLSGYLDQELSHIKRNRLEKHLKHCTPCRTALNDLKNYKDFTGKLRNMQAPPDLREKIWTELTRPVEGRKINMATNRFYLLAGVAAAAVILLMIFLPNSLNTKRIESDFAYRQIKIGKGPVESRKQSTDGSKEVRLLNEITKKVDGKVLEEGYNQQTEMTDFISLRIRKKNYPAFDSLLKEAGIEMDFPETIKGISKYLVLQLYFPGRKFATGDVNGDQKTDLMAYFKRGKNCGNWFVAFHEEGGRFKAPVGVTVGDSVFFLAEFDAPVSGDLNGDGFSDLIISVYPGKYRIFLNDKNADFMDPDLGVRELNLPSPTDHYVLLSGDMNGDGLDDIIVHYQKGNMAGHWYVALNEGGLIFSGFSEIPVIEQPYLPELRYSPLVLDFDGDGYDDCCIYWQQGEMDARWYIGINDKKGQFEKPFLAYFGSSALAFSGDYAAFTGDINGDGLWDLLVKSGTPDVTGDWYLELNENGMRFNYGSDISFGDEKDLLVK